MALFSTGLQHVCAVAIWLLVIGNRSVVLSQAAVWRAEEVPKDINLESSQLQREVPVTSDASSAPTESKLMSQWSPPLCNTSAARWYLGPRYSHEHWYAGLKGTSLDNNHSCKLQIPEGFLLVPCVDPEHVGLACPQSHVYSQLSRSGQFSMQCPRGGTFAAFDDDHMDPSPSFVPYKGPVTLNASRVVTRCPSGKQLPDRNYHALLRPPEDGRCGRPFDHPERQSMPAERLILVVLVDSIGRSSLMRSLPKTLAYLEQLDQHKYQVYEFFRFAVSGRDTSHNIPQMFAGMKVPRKRPRWGSQNAPCDSCIYLPNFLRQQNYTTCYASDLQFKTHYFGLPGRYVINETGGLEGDRLPSSASLGAHYDYFLDFGRSFVNWQGGECNRATNNAGQEYCPFDEHASKHCWGGRMAFQYVLDYASQCINEMPGCKRYVYIHLQVAHNVRMATVRTIDAPLVELLKLVVQQNGTFIITSDHGLTYSPYATAEHGRLEWKNVPLIMAFPKSLITPKMDQTLKYNTQQFVSKWDFYKTLVTMPTTLFQEKVNPRIIHHVLRKTPRKFDLFTERIPPNRTCNHAGVPEYFCLCAKWQSIIKPMELTRFYALLPIIAHALTSLANSTYCMRLSGNDLVMNAVRYTTENAHLLEVDLRVKPALLPQPHAGAVAWTVVINLPSLLLMKEAEVVSIVRTSKYGHLWACVAPEDQKYCICKEPKQLDPRLLPSTKPS